MEFLRKTLGGIGAEMGGSKEGDDTSVGEVFDKATEAGSAVTVQLMRQSKQWAEKRQFFEASLFLFVAVWTIVRAVYGGVESALKKDKRGPVNHLWSAVRTAFSSMDETVAVERMNKFEKRWEEGFYDEWR